MLMVTAILRGKDYKGPVNTPSNALKVSNGLCFEVVHGHIATEKAPASTDPCQDQNQRFNGRKQRLLNPLHVDPSENTAADQQEHMTLRLHALTPATHPAASPGQTFLATQGKRKDTTLEKRSRHQWDCPNVGHPEATDRQNLMFWPSSSCGIPLKSSVLCAVFWPSLLYHGDPKCGPHKQQVEVEPSIKKTDQNALVYYPEKKCHFDCR